jgi:hypothetical protein
MLRTIKKFVCLSFVTLLLSVIALGQGGVATGDLHVSVKDPKGNFVGNAMVTVRDEGKGVERTANSDGEGGYSAQLLPPGTYSVTIDAPGFGGILSTGVVITVGGLVELPVTLALATSKEVVEVTSQAELVETSRTSTTDTIGQRRIDNLPINGRNYINFTLTDSQVVRDNAPNTGAAPTSGLNMSGQRARSNLVNVDGADATDNSVNGVRSTVSQEAVQEFQIITNSYSAEYGRAAGGVVNIITRSGSNGFHGDIFGYLRNRNFQAVNPFSTVPDPAYTRVQAGAAFGGALKKDKTFFYFAYEITRRHETGFSSIGQGNFGLVPFDASPFFGAPAGTFDIQVTPDQAAYIANPSTPLALAQQYAILAGGSSGVALTGQYPASFAGLVALGVLPTPANASNPLAQFITTCQNTGPICAGLPGSFQTLNSQMGNYPVFEGTSVYSLRLDHNVSNNNRIMMRANVSPSTITGIEVGGQDQPFGQNAYSRTSQQTFRDVAGTFQDVWTIGNNKVNEFRFQYARRGLAYFYNTQTPLGSDPAVNIPGYAYFGREPYSYIQRTEQRYQFTDNFSWTIGRHDTKFGFDLNYIPIKAIFTVNYGGVIDVGSLSASDLGLPGGPGLSPIQAYGAGIPADVIQGLGSPSDSFHNIPIGVFWQDSWRASHNLTINYGLRYDVEIPPTLKPIGSSIAQAAYQTLGVQKGINTATHNFQPRIGMAWDPKGDGKTVVRASYGIFFDHPLLGLYFLGDASDGSSSGQLAFGPGTPCAGAGNPGNLNAVEIFQGLIPPAGSANPGLNPCSPTTNPAVLNLLNFSPNSQLFSCPTGGPNCGVASTTQSIFLGQNYLNPSNFLPLGFQPFGYPQQKNFVYAYAQQANLTFERDLGGGLALSLAYNFNGGRHLNRPINANTIRGDLMTANFEAALADGQSFTSPFTVVGECNPAGGPFGPVPFVDASLMNFFRPGGINPSIAGGYLAVGDPLGCVAQAMATVASLPGFNANCNPLTLSGCVPFGDMDANYSNGSSAYNGLTANLRKRFGHHYEFLASYTYSHSIDDSTDLQSTLTPQDSYYPGEDRSTSLFDQRHRLVFSGVYQTGQMHGGAVRSFFSNWTFAPLLEVASGRPFNIITGNDDNLQLSSLTGRPNTVVSPICTAAGYTPVASKYSPTGMLQEPCLQQYILTGVAPNLHQLDGNLGRNAGVEPWVVFNDMRIAKRLYFGERVSMDLIADMFNIANKMNVSAVSPLFTNAGQATAAYDPRQFQFAVKVNW